MSLSTEDEQQGQNTANLVMSTFYRLADKDGVSASDIAEFLRDKYGNVWKIETLINKAEETLKRSYALGFLNKRGLRYTNNLMREHRCCRRRRRRRVCCCPRRCRRRRRCCS